MLSSSSSVFDNLPTRPPTPPKDISKAVQDAISYLDDSNEVERALKGSRPSNKSSDTPPQHSPSPSQELAAGSNPSKKVGFTPNPTYHQIALAGQQSSPSALLQKSIPLRRDVKPLKSILKQSNIPPPLTPDDLETRLNTFSPLIPGSFGKMLHSVIQQLAGQSVSSRLDAYLALNGALKAYEGIPDVDAMVAKMSLLMQFITRDMAWKNTSGTLDVNIVTQALKLTAAILYDQKLSASLDDDFRTFLIDRSIAVLEQPEMPKAVVKTHLYLLAQQRFSSAMTAGRADRIISALVTIEEKCSGNSAVATRLVIYQKLLDQARNVMVNRIRDWLEPVIHCMLSSVKDVRIRAIEMCTQAGLTLGTQPHASKALMEIFIAEVQDDQSYCDYLSLRLMQMIAEKELGAYVPQIWSAIVLFFRNKRCPLEKWQNFKTWLMIIQKCLNSSDLTVRYHGHLAWNKLVFTVMPDSSLGCNMFSMLKVPPTMGMDKRGSDKHSKQIRQYALDSYYNVLHYGFRPGLSYEDLDSAWDVYIEPVLSGMVKANEKGRYIACRVIHGLCTASTGLWNINAAFEPSPIRPEELPKLEPRWVRSRLAKILRLMEPILASAMWMAPKTTAALTATWHAVMQSVAEAGSQEVKTSNELKEAIALLYNHFRTLWTECSNPPAGTDAIIFIDCYTAFMTTATQCIGFGPFAEDILLKTKGDAIQAALTPSHRSSKHHSAPRSPYVFLFGLLYQPPTALADCDTIATAASRILRLLVSARPSPALRIDLLYRSAQTWSTVFAKEAQVDIASTMWACIADCATDLLEAVHTYSEDHESQTLGLELRNAAGVLAHGMRHVCGFQSSLEAASRLISAMAKLARAEAGTGGAILAVIEPAAKAVVEADASLSLPTRLQLANEIVERAAWPRSRQELDQARKVLWGVGLAPHKPATFDPYDFIYQLLNDVMLRSYNSLENFEDEESAAFVVVVRSLVTFLKGAPLSLLAPALRKVQDGLAIWVEDADRKTSSANAVRDMVCSTWQEVLQMLERLPQHDTTLLSAIEPLLVAGFSSPHKAVVNESIVFWNASFGRTTTLEYPRKLEKVLRARARETELCLPHFTEGDNEDASTSLPAFYETQVEALLQQERPRTAVARENHDTSRVPSTAPPVRSAHFPVKVPMSSGKPASSPAVGASEKRVRSDRKARLRHEDSQVQFAPIDSSPVRFEESQMLTERQKEIKARQKDNAQLFPDLSSSPVMKQNVQKRLDFTSERTHDDDNNDAATPIDMLDAEGPMSDDIPSSPTPSSTKDAEPTRVDVDEEHVSDMDMAQDPPSSPPREADETDAVGEVYIFESANDDDGEMPKLETEPEVAGTEDEHYETAPPLGIEGSDLPSDTPLPTEQLLREEQDATEIENGADEDEETVGTTFINPHPTTKPVEPETVQRFAIEIDDEDSYPQEEHAEPEITRIENSFIELPAPEASQGATDSNTGSPQSQQSQRNGKKRKRSSAAGHSSKKRKHESPLKQAISFFSSFVRQSQQEDDDDEIEDEIVVASSQPSTSPAVNRVSHTTRSPIVEVPVRRSERQTDVVKEEPATSEPAQKRSRGRPRKSETPAAVSSQEQPTVSKALKRKASTLSVASGTEAEPTTSIVEDTPAPSKARKQRRGQDAKLVQAARLSPDGTEAGRSSRRKSTGASTRKEAETDVMELENTEEGLEEAGNAEPAIPEKQPEEGDAATAVEERPIATPRSIIDRLRGVLPDLRKMFVGSQDERELDDVLFEIKREVFEAGRRGRDQAS